VQSVSNQDKEFRALESMPANPTRPLWGNVGGETGSVTTPRSCRVESWVESRATMSL